MEPTIEPVAPVEVPRNPFIPIIATALIAALVAGGAVYLWQRNENQKAKTDLEAQISKLRADLGAVPTPTPTVSPTATATPTASPTADWKTYTNATYGFTFQYPPQWKLDEVKTSQQSNVQEPWKSFEFYASYTPSGAQDNYGYVGVSKKSIDELIEVEWIGASDPKREVTTFAGQTATKMTASFNDGPGTDFYSKYYIVKSGYTYSISGPTFQASAPEYEKTIYSQIDLLVPTFAFTK
jgi:hypothetical protein